MEKPNVLVDVLMEAAIAVGAAIAELSFADRAIRTRGHIEQYLPDVHADLAARKVLTGHGLGVFSEESGMENADAPVHVILDPIDGSANCATGHGPFGPSLCAVDERGPLAAAVLDLSSNTWFAAARGQGAVHNGQPLSRHPADRMTALAVGDADADWGDGLRLDFTGASAHDLCRVASGEVDGYLDRDNTQAVWDYLAAALVIGELGGIVVDACGGQLWSPGTYGSRHRVAAAASPVLWEHMAPLIRRVPPCP